MKLLNIEKDGLGISFFNTIDKKNNLLEIFMNPEGTNLEGVTELFGEFAEPISSPINENIDEITRFEEKVSNLVKEGYVHIYTDEKTGKSFYVKPTTSQNAKIINSLSMFCV